MVHAVPDSECAYCHVPSGVVRVNVAVLPSAQVIPLLPPLYEYVIVPPVSSLIDATRPV